MLPAEGYVTTDDGLRLWFQTVGSGPQVVVLPNGFHLLEDFSCLAPGRTLVFYDVRNRGRSDTVTDPALLQRGIHNDVDDLDAMRRHFGLGRLAVIGHSYMGLMVILYAMKYAAHVDRIVQIGAMGPYHGKTYAADLTNTDAVLRDVFTRIGALQTERASLDPEELCRKSWAILREMYVTDPKNADKVRWDRCDLANERNFMPYWTGAILPSIRSLRLTAEDFAKVEAPVLTVHGTKDRSAPYGGGIDWASLLPNARLLSLEGTGHAPWIEEGPALFDAIETILRSGLVATDVG
jgi:proline iminopeptidase